MRAKVSLKLKCYQYLSELKTSAAVQHAVPCRQQ